MWLAITLAAAISATALHLKLKNSKTYQLGFLSLMLWGAFIMVLADHVIAFVHDGGEFFEVTTDGLVSSGAVLGILMIVPLFAIWAFAAFTPLGARLRVE